MRVNLAHTIARSAANGPGERYVLWTQGCPLACPGCWNPDTWRFERRDLRDVEELFAEIRGVSGIEGVTFTGGEPFSQARALAALGRMLRDVGLSVFVFSGYELDELTHTDDRALLDVTDVLVAGRYLAQEREEGLVWRGSRNQRVHFLTARYGPADMLDAPEAEIRIEADGRVTLTGFPFDDLQRDNRSVMGE